MNDIRRARISKAISLITQAGTYIDNIYDEESLALDSVPENLQSSVRYENMEAAVECLEEASDMIEELKDLLEKAKA